MRPATAADRELLVEIFASTRARELALLGADERLRRWFVESQFSAQEADYQRRFPEFSRSVVLIGGVDAGRLYVVRREREIRILDIALLPAYRGRGIGTGLLRGLIDEAAAARARVCLNVAADNPVRRLYERLGFRYTHDDDGVYLAMQWRQPGA